MSSSRIGRLTALISSVAVVLAAVPLPAASAAKTPVGKPAPKPRISTDAATHVLGTSALLTATITPNNQETDYFFRYGPVTLGPVTFASQTPTASAGAGPTKVAVGQAIGGLSPGSTYRYKAFAVSPAGTILAEGKEHTFKTKGAVLTFVVARTQQATYGSPFLLSGTLTGANNGSHRIALQASPFPYLEPFTTIGLPGLTNAAGSFSFRVANLRESTQFRVTTLDPLPVYSPVITVDVRVRVALHVRSSGQRGVVRLYGTIAPAVNGAKVALQVQKAVHPSGNSEVTSRWVNQFITVAKKNGASASRFSVVVTVRHGGRYRAYVKLPATSKLASGQSPNTVILRAAPVGALGKGKKG
ncbi:MAG TPA: hypothetical protein VKG82_01270 [Solirubrobacteraceae bacterium]|nr:hypothetical protein [Solirubrobacteraceae bacterium]